jgi:hypothetical protein
MIQTNVQHLFRIRNANHKSLNTDRLRLPARTVRLPGDDFFNGRTGETALTAALLRQCPDEELDLPRSTTVNTM